MAVDRFIIIRNVHSEGKNALIVAKKKKSQACALQKAKK